MGRIFLSLILLTTTSVQDSGILDKIVEKFEKKYKCNVKVIAVGSGAAFRLGMDGQGDLLIVHDRDGEERFIKQGYGFRRYPFMWNEFVLCGPVEDPVGVRNARNIYDAFRKIYNKRAVFVSRGDNSGTHKKEMEIWRKIGIKPAGNSYIEAGNGMIETLRIAEEKSAYVLSDISTFDFHRKEFSNITILLKDRKNLKNFYSLIPVSPLKFKDVNYNCAMRFIEFVLKGEGRIIIKNSGLFNLLD